MKQKLKGGFEYDCVTGWRKFLSSNAGKWKYVKRKLNKRFRKEGKQDIEEQLDD